MTFLDIRFNNFEGEVPSEVFDMDLDVLFLNSNFFNGELPSNFWDTPAIYMTMAYNAFTGCIPEVNAIKNLQEVLLLNNQFTGTLPVNWEGTVNLTVFDAGTNQISGGVPEALCGLETLEVLNVTNNVLTEPLGPNCQALLEAGILDISWNCIEGADDQKAPEDCPGQY